MTLDFLSQKETDARATHKPASCARLRTLAIVSYLAAKCFVPK
jgi:hypothetical protein